MSKGRLDTEPGKYDSEKGHWYFSCDEGDGVLVGVKTSHSTCPILGLMEIPCTEEQLVLLEHSSKVIDGTNIFAIDTFMWDQILQREDRKTWGEPKMIAWMETDMCGGEDGKIYRLHHAFE